VFFVDGSSFARVKGRQFASDLGKASGAAVVYMSSGVWEERFFALPKGGNYLKAELAAIAEGLAIAVPEMIRGNDRNKSSSEETWTKPKVTIFTDCQNALRRINSFARSFPPNIDYATILLSANSSRDRNIFTVLALKLSYVGFQAIHMSRAMYALMLPLGKQRRTLILVSV